MAFWRTLLLLASSWERSHNFAVLLWLMFPSSSAVSDLLFSLVFIPIGRKET